MRPIAEQAGGGLAPFSGLSATSRARHLWGQFLFADFHGAIKAGQSGKDCAILATHERPYSTISRDLPPCPATESSMFTAEFWSLRDLVQGDVYFEGVVASCQLSVRNQTGARAPVFSFKTSNSKLATDN
jgi:hypothetical protein